MTENCKTLEELHQSVKNGAVVLSVGKLRKFLAEHPELSDDSPVLYQRIEDACFEKHGWKAVMLPWECVSLPAGETASNLPPNCRIITYQGQQLIQELDEFIPAFGMYVVHTDGQLPAVCIHAHY